jgi:hypothetical protein
MGLGSSRSAEGVANAGYINLSVGVNESFPVFAGWSMCEAHQVVFSMRGGVEAKTSVKEPMGRVSWARPLLDAGGVHEPLLVAGADAIDDDAARHNSYRDRECNDTVANAFKGSRDCLHRDRDKDSIVEVAGPKDLYERPGAGWSEMDIAEGGNAVLKGNDIVSNVVEGKSLKKDRGNAGTVHAGQGSGLDRPPGQSYLDRGIACKLNNLRDGSLGGRFAAGLGSN